MDQSGQSGLRLPHGGDRASSPLQLQLIQLIPLPCLLNSHIVAKVALSRLSTQSMPLIWPLSNRTQKMYFSSCLTSLVSGSLRRETSIALLKCYPGYSRIILAGFALHYMSYHPKYCTVLYCISCLLDAVDGQAARALDQTSKFGAVLDMVTDRYGTRQWCMSPLLIGRSRCTTSCLLCYLSSAYPAYALFFQFLISLDFASHYMHMYRQVTLNFLFQALNRDMLCV